MNRGCPRMKHCYPRTLVLDARLIAFHARGSNLDARPSRFDARTFVEPARASTLSVLSTSRHTCVKSESTRMKRPTPCICLKYARQTGIYARSIPVDVRIQRFDAWIQTFHTQVPNLVRRANDAMRAIIF